MLGRFAGLDPGVRKRFNARMTEMEVFKAPEGLARELIEFFGDRPCRPLTELAGERPSLSRHIGVYALYPAPGAHPLYESVGEANGDECHLPIYVGKAVPRGARTGQAEKEGRTNASNNLYLRLREHRASIDQAENLDIGSFSFRVAAMEIDLVAWGESVLIGHFQPAWNQIISGFGIHDPGGGRARQQRSVWDRLHPGRTAAKRLPVAEPVDEGEYRGRIDALSGRMRRELDLS